MDGPSGIPGSNICIKNISREYDEENYIEKFFIRHDEMKLLL